MTAAVSAESIESFVETGYDNEYMYIPFLYIPGAGLLYVFSLLAPYDPAILQTPPQLVFVIYLTFLLSGVAFLAGWVAHRARRRLYSLYGLGLAITLQSAALAGLLAAIAPAATNGVFIALLGSPALVAHVIRGVKVYRQIQLAAFRDNLLRKVKGES